MYCRFCGKLIKDDSRFCPQCGKNLELSAISSCIKNIRLNLCKEICIKFVHSRFFRLYIAWTVIQCVLFIKAKLSYSNYFNNENVNPNAYNYFSVSNDRDIYPINWLYPFKNLLSGINGQDPVYVYDGSEFFLYTILLPFLSGLFIIKREIWFGMSTQKKSKISYWTVYYISVWMILVFPMGIFGLNFLGRVFILTAIIIGLHGYNKIKE